MQALVLFTLSLLDPVQSGSIQNTVPSPAMVRIEHRLCREKFTKLYVCPYGGMSIKFMFRFEGGHKGLFKPAQTRSSARYKAEIAAYRLATHLGVDMVPPVCERTVPLAELQQAAAGPKFAALRKRMATELIVGEDGLVHGAVMHWVPHARETKLGKRTDWHAWLETGSTVPRKKLGRARALADLLLLDLLYLNPDRFTGGNLLEALPARRLLMIDNGASFRQVAHLDRTYSKAGLALLGRVRRQTYRRMLRLTPQRLAAVVRRSNGFEGYLLTRRERRALLKRRDLLRRHVRALAQKSSWRDVYLR